MKRFQVLDGSLLKLIGLAAMIMDHTASILLEDNHFVVLSLGGYTMDLYMLFRYVGRISFPIYAFLLVEGFLHTSDLKRYAGTLLGFALLSELPWNLAHTGTVFFASQNVLFTLFFGLMGITVIRDGGDRPFRQACLLLGLLAVALIFRADFGLAGFGFILAMYLLRRNRLCQAAVGTCMLSANWMAGFAFIPIGLYNGQRGMIRGRYLKYAFYAAYPLHLLILYFIRNATIGY